MGEDRADDRFRKQKSHKVDDLPAPIEGPPPLGTRLRSLRRKKQWTLAALAEKSGVSKAQLSKIERGETSPTVALAARIAGALGIGLSELIQQPSSNAQVRVTRAAERLEFRDPKTGLVRELISPPFENRRFELVRHLLPQGSSSGRLPAYPRGVEKQLVVTRGQLRVQVDEASYALDCGDALYFEADVEHEFVNTGDVDCDYFLVVCAPLRI